MSLTQLITRAWQIPPLTLGLVLGFILRLLDLAQAAGSEGVKIGRGR